MNYLGTLCNAYTATVFRGFVLKAQKKKKEVPLQADLKARRASYTPHIAI